MMFVTQIVSCPYCGERFEANFDTSSETQEYIEDCYICCRPITFRVACDYEGNLTAVELHRDDE